MGAWGRRRAARGARRGWGTASATLGLACVVGALVLGAVRRVQVRGDSMVPTLEAGDHVVLLKVPEAWPLRPGTLVAVRDPRSAGRQRLMVKRVRYAGPLGVDVRGDNPSRSTDSRSFGPVPRDHVVGCVVYRYAPAARAGRLR